MKKCMMLLICALALFMMLPHGMAQEAIDETLGRPMPDFTVETIDGGTFTLSEALQDHDMVLINLWATWCPPCEAEFPFMQEAYAAYSDRVAIIALSIEPTDTPEKLTEYAQAHGMTFPVGSDSGIGIGSQFPTGGIPTSIVVDRFGNVALVEVGSQPSTSAFTALFDYFLDDGYTETQVLDGMPKPRAVQAEADLEKLAAAANAEGGNIAFRNPDDAQVWPMLVDESDGRAALRSSNAGVAGTTAAIYATVEAGAGDALAFEFRTSCEAACDLLCVSMDGVPVKYFSGEHPWTEWALPLDEGSHEIAFSYIKDDMADQGDDCAWIDGVCVVSGDDAAARLSAVPSLPVAEAFEFEPVEDTAMRIEFDDEDRIIGGLFGGLAGCWIVDGDTASMVLRLPADIDPETVGLYSEAGGELIGLDSLSIDEDGTGWLAQLPVSNGTDSVPFTRVYAYAMPSDPEQARSRCVLLLPGEEGADAFVEMMANYDISVSWRYAE